MAPRLPTTFFISATYYNFPHSYSYSYSSTLTSSFASTFASIRRPLSVPPFLFSPTLPFPTTKNNKTTTMTAPAENSMSHSPSTTPTPTRTFSTMNSPPNGTPHSSSPHSSSTNAYRGEILCNRALNMSKIKSVGFDMDYTLAMYYSEQFETLSATNALQKLVHELGYPTALLSLKYDHSRFIRGLVVDKQAGNIIKLDRHKYVKRAMHGHTPLSKEARATMYDTITHSGGGFGEPRFAVLDAMFALPDAFLFSSVVAYKDEHPDEIKQSYERIYKDVRTSVDMCHRDGSIKDRVAEDPARYIQRDDQLMPLLRRLRQSGRKVFLLTNSLWNYTDVVMKFLHKGETQEGHWIDLFDVIITGSSKPAFMLNNRLPIYRCDPNTGDLRNTDGVYNEAPEEYLSRGKCFQGGNYQHLHDMLGVDNGTQVLYVGDHIFSDVLRSKRTLGWRTVLVVPELEHEVNTIYHPDSESLFDEIQLLHDTRDELDEWVDRLESILMNSSEHKQDAATELDAARRAREQVRAKIVTKIEAYHHRFHPLWGQLFKTGLQNSRFAEQVESYACLYTSKVSNIALVSPEVHWRAMNDLMPHDRLTVAPMHRVLTKRALVGDGEQPQQNHDKL